MNALLEILTLIAHVTQRNWYPRTRWHSRWKLSEEFQWKGRYFLQKCPGVLVKEVHQIEQELMYRTVYIFRQYCLHAVHKMRCYRCRT